jgi:hypothetical protein
MPKTEILIFMAVKTSDIKDEKLSTIREQYANGSSVHILFTKF